MVFYCLSAACTNGRSICKERRGSTKKVYRCVRGGWSGTRWIIRMPVARYGEGFACFVSRVESVSHRGWRCGKCSCVTEKEK